MVLTPLSLKSKHNKPYSIMIATSIQQSKNLIEAGVDANTADMCWNISLSEDKPRLETEPYTKFKEKVNKYFQVYDKCFEVVPAWSLGALMKLIPHPKLERTDEREWISSYCHLFWKDEHTVRDVTNSGYNKNPIDSCYQLLLHYIQSEKPQKL